eukprot:446616_1
MNNLFICLVNKWPHDVQDLNRLLICKKYWNKQTKIRMDNYLCIAIQNLFVTYTQNSKIQICQIHDNIKAIIESKLHNQELYITSMQYGMKLYLIQLNTVKLNDDNNNHNNFNYFHSMLQQTETNNMNAKEELKRFHHTFSTIPGCQDQIADLFKLHINDVGSNYIQKSKSCKYTYSNDCQLIQSLIDLNQTFLKMINNEFRGNDIFNKSLKYAFEEFMNKDYYVSKVLARFANDALKRKHNTFALDDKMDHIIALYKFIKDKDIFEKEYECYLVCRLIRNLCDCERAEKIMINKLKSVSGYQWISKLENIIKDVEGSEQLMSKYKQKYGDMNILFNVKVFTTGNLSWQNVQQKQLQIPLDINIAKDTFIQFYENMYSGRMLTFQMDKGHAEIEVNFNAQTRKVLVVSTYQMIILLLFNNAKTLTFKQMFDATKISREYLFKAVMSMAHPKIKVLRKSPNIKECNDDHKFQINTSYKNLKVKIEIPTIKMRNVIEINANSVEMEKILKQREHRLDAAIVRVLKENKILHHCEVYVAVKRQLKHVYNVSMEAFRKRIRKLFEMEYLLIKKTDVHIYKYYKIETDEFGDVNSNILPCNGCDICNNTSYFIPKAETMFEQKEYVMHEEIQKCRMEIGTCSDANNAEILINIKSLNGNKITLKTRTDATILLIRYMLLERCGYSLETIKLIYKGKLLNDTDRLCDIGVQDGGTIHQATTGCLGG